ncbi:MAG TPA: CopD family protein [Sphingomonadaceae bacterium]|nr:CopD family protein [Sphingomonadaceae bacterium]
MQDVLAMIFYWLKAAHIIFVIFWMAGLFMLPRYFIYHQECPEDSSENGVWIERERKLLKIIMTPSIIVVWAVGLLLAYHVGAFNQGWFHAKLAVVLGLSAYHGWLAGYAKKLALGQRAVSGKNLRMLNEIPGVAAAIIVILVVIKPF